MAEIIGRRKEIKELQDCYQSKRSEFIVVYGRRRVGKTYLVNNVFEDRLAFQHTGLSPFELKDEVLSQSQLTNFYSSLKRYGYKGNDKPDDWLSAFDALISLLSSQPKDKPQVVFIDEIAWMDTPRSGFITAFEHFWNGWGANRGNLKLVVCSSAASWVMDNIINNRGGLFDRTTREIHLSPFTLGETSDYLDSIGVTYDHYDVLQTYMAVGGVPYYLSFIQPGMSVAENIDNLFFEKNAKLKNEYKNLFSSQFANPEACKGIIDCLTANKTGCTRAEIMEKGGFSSGGTLSQQIKSLMASDFIMSYVPYKGKKRDMKYKIIDPCILFSTKFAQKTTNDHYWRNNQNSATLNTWRGLAFENVCFSHIPQIKTALGINGVQTEVLPWHSEQKSGGAQTDMIIDRADRIVNICEMKFYNTEFVVDKDYDEKLRNKLDVFLRETKLRKSVLMTLVTTYGLGQSRYSGRFQNVITMDQLFL